MPQTFTLAAGAHDLNNSRGFFSGIQSIRGHQRQKGLPIIVTFPSPQDSLNQRNSSQSFDIVHFFLLESGAWGLDLKPAQR